MVEIFPRRIPIDDTVFERVKKQLRDPSLEKKFLEEMRKLENRLAIQDALLSKLQTKVDRFEEMHEKYKQQLAIELTRKKIDKSKTQTFDLFFKRPYKLKVLSTFLDENKPFYLTEIGKDKRGNPVANHEIYPYFAGIRFKKEEGGDWILYFLLGKKPNCKEPKAESPPICYLASLEGVSPIRSHLLDLGVIGLDLRLDGRPVPPYVVYRPDIELKEFRKKDQQVIKAKLEVFNKADDKEKMKILLSVYEQMIKLRNKYEDLQEKYDAVCQDLTEIRSMAKALVKRGDINNALFEKLIEEAGRANYESVKAKTTIATQSMMNMALRELLENISEKFEEIKRMTTQETKSPTEVLDVALTTFKEEIDRLRKETEKKHIEEKKE